MKSERKSQGERKSAIYTLIHAYTSELLHSVDYKETTEFHIVNLPIHVSILYFMLMKSS